VTGCSLSWKEAKGPMAGCFILDRGIVSRFYHECLDRDKPYGDYKHNQYVADIMDGKTHLIFERRKVNKIKAIEIYLGGWLKESAV
jgi:hypothetical protein